MGRIACFSLFSWKRSMKTLQKQNATTTDSKDTKVKVLNSRVWPRDDFSPNHKRKAVKPHSRHVPQISRPQKKESHRKQMKRFETSRDGKVDFESYLINDTEVYPGESSRSSLENPSFSDKVSSIIPSEKSCEVNARPLKIIDKIDDEDISAHKISNASGSESSNSSNKNYVEAWISEIEEPSHDEVEAANEMHKKAEHINPDLELSNIATQSLDPCSFVAHLSRLGLKSIPCLGAFSNLRSLSLSANSILRICPGSLPSNLHFLDLSRNQITTIEGLRSLTRLRILNLSYNRITRIGHGLANCTSIRELYLQGNKISEIQGLHRLRKLYLLDVSCNRLTTTKSVGQLAANYSSLKALNVMENPVVVNIGEEQLRRFVSAILANLTYLNRQPIKAIPAHEALVGKLALTAVGTSSHHSRKTNSRNGMSKAKRVQSLQTNKTHLLRNAKKSSPRMEQLSGEGRIAR